jgi:hypothetical protein
LNGITYIPVGLKLKLETDRQDTPTKRQHGHLINLFSIFGKQAKKQTTDLKLEMSEVSTAASELSEYKFDLVGMQEVISDKGSADPADYIIFFGNGNKYHHFWMRFLVCK